MPVPQILRRGLAATLAALVALALAACAGSPAAAPTSAPAAEATTAPTAAPLAEATSAPATEATSVPTAAPVAEATTTPASAPVAAVPAKLNLNTVTEQELTASIPGFGGRMVREFFEYRPYISIQQFRREIGKYVSAEQVSAYEQYVYVPVDIDASDEATLQQIPGVDANVAAQLVAARPFGSPEAFLTKLAELAPAVDPATAVSYLAQ